MKKSTKQLAQETSFEKIFSTINRFKIEVDTIQNDIDKLTRERNLATSVVGRWNQIALTKRRAIVNKK